MPMLILYLEELYDTASRNKLAQLTKSTFRADSFIDVYLISITCSRTELLSKHLQKSYYPNKSYHVSNFIPRPRKLSKPRDKELAFPASASAELPSMQVRIAQCIITHPRVNVKTWNVYVLTYPCLVSHNIA